jgi:hypothetical protein
VTPPLPFRPGEFVWSAFPQTEHPDRPSRHLHLGYVLTVTESRLATWGPPLDFEHQAVLAYTTSQPWPHAAGRPGVISFSPEQALMLGQRRPFVLHLWRVAHLPVTLRWFPRLSTPERGVVGRVSATQRRQLETETTNVFTRHPDTVERLGPLRPGPSKR